METVRKPTLNMRTLLLCSDVQFTGITRSVLSRLQVTPKMVGNCEAALGAMKEYEFDVIVVDWREIDNLAKFLCAVRRSKINRHCVLVAIVRDMLDLKQSLPACGVLRPSGATAEAASGTGQHRGYREQAEPGVSANGFGMRFKYMPEHQRSALQQWLTGCVERSLAKLCDRIRAACA